MGTRLILTLIGCLIPVGVWAQLEGGRGSGDRPFERVEQWKKVRMIEMLDLQEEQSVRFFARLNEHEKKRRELIRQKHDVLDRIERMVRGGAEDAQFEKVIAEVEDIDVKIAAGQKEFAAGLKDILSTEQRAKMMLFERRFQSELREAMRELQRNRGREGGKRE